MISFEQTSHHLEALGGRLHYNDIGEGTPLICVHGGGSGANAWDNTKWALDGLSADHRVLLLDLPGYGTSDNLEAEADESRDRYYARAVLALMDSLGLEAAHLFGPSMGATPMIRIAHDHPDRVLKLVLKSPAGMGKHFLTPSPMDGIRALDTFRQDPTFENMTQLMRLFVPGKGLLTDALIEARFASAQQAMMLKPAARKPTELADIRALLPKLTMPTLVLWGHQDRMVAMDGALGALALIPKVEVHLWGGGTGHFVEFEHADAFNRVVISFLKA
ncbi:pimeloyl-ACP methyl ester carboxylesterase [Sphingomonas vulcanisoli]|uniref:Pimeloyl-ACP methyl ester carboxylesterase n=1 Tax=Sphingomonas vulcanisoli TaxID=1658060 RepID=A0ABX0TUP6_9SPHN|nr:alpha/beta fold hydrolase [Sphingomonas vulcanisoli]NIJ09256.1 pimeloyl-ACP methyl ester carboxylesterase [Sphingomonas vulcanisoli]